MAANRGVVWRHRAAEDKPTSPSRDTAAHPRGRAGRGVCSHCCHSKSCPSSSSLASGETPLPSSCAKNSPCFQRWLCWTPGPSSHKKVLRHVVGWGLPRAECASCFSDQQCQLLCAVPCPAVPEPAVLPEEGCAPLLCLGAAHPRRYVPAVWEEQIGCQTFGGSQ